MFSITRKAFVNNLNDGSSVRMFNLEDLSRSIAVDEQKLVAMLNNGFVHIYDMKTAVADSKPVCKIYLPLGNIERLDLVDGKLISVAEAGIVVLSFDKKAQEVLIKYLPLDAQPCDVEVASHEIFQYAANKFKCSIYEVMCKMYDTSDIKRKYVLFALQQQKFDQQKINKHLNIKHKASAYCYRPISNEQDPYVSDLNRTIDSCPFNTDRTQGFVSECDWLQGDVFVFHEELVDGEWQICDVDKS